MDFWHWLSEGASYLVLFVAFAASAGAVINHLVEFRNKMTKPRHEIEQRLETLEDKLDKFIDAVDESHKEYQARFERDLKRHKKNEEESKIILRSLLTLITSSIDGDHLEELEERRMEIQDYLINKS